MTAEEEAVRAAEVFRRWRRTSLDVMRRASWTGWSPEDAGFVVGASCAILLLLLEPALWFKDWPPPFFGEHVLSWLAPSFLLVPLHGWLLDRFLSAKTPCERAMPRWLLALRFAAACIPLFSFGLLPAWRIFLERRPAWASPISQPRLNLSWNPLRTRPSPRLLWPYNSGFFAFLMAGSFALPILWVLGLARMRALGNVSTLSLVAVCVVLHGVAFLSARFGSRRTIAWLSLLPLPGPLIGILVPVKTDPLGENTKTLTWSAWARRGTTSHLPLWLRSEESLLRQWKARPWFLQWKRPRQIERKVGAGEIESKLLSLYRAKTLLLFLEGGVLVAGLSKLSDRFPRLGRPISSCLEFSTFFGMAVAGLGLILLVIAAVAGILRVPGLAGSKLGSFGRSLLFTQAAFIMGSQLGFLWLQGRIREMALLIAYGGALLAILTWMFFLPIFGSFKLRTVAVWSGLFLLLASSGIPLMLNDRFDNWPVRLLGGATPLGGLLLFQRWGHSLLRPYSGRDLVNRRLPGRTRAALIFMGLTAALPGGGLAIPIWIALRDFLQESWRGSCSVFMPGAHGSCVAGRRQS